MKTCTKCGAQYSDTDTFCPIDGTVLSTSSSASEDPFIGRTIDRKYRILEKLGGGGMGVVYKAEHIYLNQIVAIKVLRSHISQDNEYLQRFQREAKTACRIKHPSAISLFDFGVDGEFPYLAMEYVEGETLTEILKNGGPLSIVRTFNLTTQICGALSEAHELGIIHRDLKPENIMVAKHKDGSDWAKVLDFGIAKVIQADNDANPQLTRLGTVFGSPRYMAPEQALQKDIDQRADLYSVGVVVYEMLTNKVPFLTSSAMEVILKHLNEKPIPLIEAAPPNAISPGLNDVVMKLLEKEPENRYATADLFLQAFRKACLPQLGESEAAAVLKYEKPSLLSRWLVPFAAATCIVIPLTVYVSRQHRPQIQTPSSMNAEMIKAKTEMKELDQLKAEKEAEAAQAQRIAEQKHSEALHAAEEAEEQKAKALATIKEIELLKQERKEEEAKANELKEEVESATAALLEQQSIAKHAAEEAEKTRLAREAEEKRAAELKLEAQKAETLVEQQKQEALQAMADAEEHRQARLREEEAATKLKLEAAQAAIEADRLKNEAEKAEIMRAQAEEAAKSAEQQKAKAELAAKELKAKQTSESLEQVKSDSQSETANRRALAEEARKTEALRQAREAEERHLNALREARKAEEERLLAQEAARAAQAAQEASASQKQAEENNTQDDEASRPRLPHQGKRRF